MEINIKLNSAPSKISKNNLLNKDYTNVSGVYVLFDVNDTCLYIGKTSNLYSRMMGHSRESEFYRELDYAEFYNIESEYKKDILETFLISELKPIYNKAKTYYKQDDYELILEELDLEIDELKSEIEHLRYYLFTSLEERYPEIPLYLVGDTGDDYEDQLENIDKEEEKLELAELERRLRYLQNRKQAIAIRKSL